MSMEWALLLNLKPSASIVRCQPFHLHRLWLSPHAISAGGVFPAATSADSPLAHKVVHPLQLALVVLFHAAFKLHIISDDITFPEVAKIVYKATRRVFLCVCVETFKG